MRTNSRYKDYTYKAEMRDGTPSLIREDLMTTYSARGVSASSHTARPRLELDLMDGDRRYGWIAGDRVGFVGFGDHVEAVQAAWVAHRTVMRRLARSPAAAAAMSDDARTFALVSYGEDEMILANETPIAVLVRPDRDGASDRDSYGFVIRIPGDADHLDVRATAYRIYLALKSSGIRWTLRRANVSPAAPEQDTRPTNADHLVADNGDTTTSEDGGRNDDIDQSRQRARRFLPSQWGRRRRASAKERAERRVRRLRYH